MKPFHILTALRGEQDAQVALVLIDAALLARIADARETITAYLARHSSHGGIKDLSDIHIDFLKGVPEIAGSDLCDDDYCDDPIRLDDLDRAVFLDAAVSQSLYVRSECTGLVIRPDGIWITGYEKHCDHRIESDDILPLIRELLPDAPLSARPPLDDQQLATVLAALRYYQQQGQGDPANRSDAIHAIATDCDRLVSLDSDAIDQLCEAINCPA